MLLLTLALTTAIFITRQDKVLGAETENSQTKIESIKAEISFWDNFLEKNPDYKDGWFELTTLYTKLGDKQSAEASLNQASLIDPNDPRAIKFFALITNSSN